MILDIARQFSTYPSGRHPKDGTFNGESFRVNLLVPALKSVDDHEVLEVVIDGVRSFGSSFLEEAFGGLMREEGFTLDQLNSRMKIVCTKSHLKMYKDAISEYMTEAEDERKKS